MKAWERDIQPQTGWRKAPKVLEFVGRELAHASICWRSWCQDVRRAAGSHELEGSTAVADLGTLTREAPVSKADHAAHVARIIGAYRQIIARAHAKGIKVIGGTIMPFVGNGYYHADRDNEADRQAVNAWIRAPGHFDAMVDFDRVMRDPARPERLRPAFDDGDALHPSPAGYRAMGEAVPLTLFD